MKLIMDAYQEDKPGQSSWTVSAIEFSDELMDRLDEINESVEKLSVVRATFDHPSLVATIFGEDQSISAPLEFRRDGSVVWKNSGLSGTPIITSEDYQTLLNLYSFAQAHKPFGALLHCSEFMAQQEEKGLDWVDALPSSLKSIVQADQLAAKAAAASEDVEHTPSRPNRL